MAINEKNQRSFHRKLYAGTGMLQTVTCLKREDDQRQGVVRSVTLYQCRWSKIYKTGEPLQQDMATSHMRTLHVPRKEMDRTGINYFNATDTFVDRDGRHWRPESPQTITTKLLEVHVCIDCVRCDPPGGPTNAA